MLMARRSTALAVIACIALGTAAVGAVFTLVGAALLAPLPFPEADSLHRVWLAAEQGDGRLDLSLPEARDLEAGLAGVGELAIVARSRAVARLPGGAERLRGEAVTANYFALVGQAPALGRGFTAADYAGDAPPAVLISDAVWRRGFAADPGIAGRTLVTEERTLTIVGVLPPGFSGSIENDEVEYWLPLPHYIPSRIVDDRSARQSWTLLRLAPGVPASALRSRLLALEQEWAQRFPAAYQRLGLRSEPFGENWREPLRANAGLLAAAVLVLLAIAALNVSALLLARALERRRELALRAALGASRWRIARRLLLESAALVAVGGVLGVLAGTPLLELFLRLMPDALPDYVEVGFDARAMLLSALAIAGAALLAGTLPATIGSRSAPATVLASGARGATAGRHERRWGDRLVAAELACTVVLLVVAALLLRSYVSMANIDTGYRTANLLRMAVTLDRNDAAAVGELQPFQQRLLDTLRAQPGVLAAGMAWPTLPPWDEQRLEIADPRDPSTALAAGVHLVEPGLLPTLDIAIEHGRGIEQRDWQDNARVAVVSAALAERLGGADRVIGSEIDFGPEAARSLFDTRGRFRVVGVAADVAWDGIAEHGTGRTIHRDATAADPRATAWDIYLPLPPLSRGLSIAVHTGPEPAAMLAPLRQAIARLAPGSAVHWVSTMEEELAGEYAAARFYTLLVLAFAACAALLAAVGLFAVLNQAVLRRRGEIGVRLARGASPHRVARGLVLGTLRTAVLGIGAGLLLAWLAAEALRGFLYGIAPADPLAFALACAVLLAFVLLASLAPARRAARVQPLVALRCD